MYYFLAMIHWLVIAVVLLSPFFIDWKIIAIGLFIHFIVFSKIIGYCPVTKWQFKGRETGFIKYYFKKLGLKTNNERIDDLIRYWFPIIIVVFSFLWQTALW